MFGQRTVGLQLEFLANDTDELDEGIKKTAKLQYAIRTE